MHTPVERRRVNAGERCDSLLAVWCDSFSGRVMCDSFSGKTLRCDRTARRNGSVPGEGIVRRVDSRHHQKIDLETYVNSTSERTYHTPRVSLSLSRSPICGAFFLFRTSRHDRGRETTRRDRVTSALLLYISETRM